MYKIKTFRLPKVFAMTNSQFHVGKTPIFRRSLIVLNNSLSKYTTCDVNATPSYIKPIFQPPLPKEDRNCLIEIQTSKCSGGILIS